MQELKNGNEMATPKYPKSDERHWQNRVEFYKHKNQAGNITQDKTYSIRISHQKKRHVFQLHTANKKLAGQKARDIYLSLKSNGWDETLDRFKPKSSTITNEPTIGDVIRVYSEVADVPVKTAANYARVLRSIVADIKKISGDKKRFDYVNGGAEKWRAKVDAVKLSYITPLKVQRWKLAYVKERSVDPVKEKSAKLTVNSYIRYCRSLFSQKVLPYLSKELELPDTLPFDGVELYPRQSMKYTSTFDIEKLALKAPRVPIGLS